MRAGCRGTAFCAHYLAHDDDPRIAFLIAVAEQARGGPDSIDAGGYDERDRANGAVTIDNSASAALLWQRAACRTTWKSRSGRSKPTRCSNPASRLGAATDAEIAVAPNPASTAARTASLDGSSSATRNAPGDTPKPCKAASNVDRVPDPGSRKTQSVSISLSGSSRPVADQACSVPTTISNWSRATCSFVSIGSSIAPSMKPRSAAPSRSAAATCAELPMVRRMSMPGYLWRNATK